MLKKQSFVYVLIIITLLLTPSLITNYLTFLFGINLTIFRIIAFFSLIIVAAMSKEQMPTFSFVRKSLIYYSIGILLLFFLLLLTYNLESIIYYIRVLPTFVLLLIIMKDRSFSMPKFISYYLFATFILSLLSIIQYFATPFGLVSFSNVNFAAEGTVVSFGGFSSYNAGILYGGVPRNFGFYTEPTNFAQFLLIPLFISYYKFVSIKSLKNSLYFITIAIAFFLTFSIANFFGVFFGVLAYNFLKLYNYQRINKRKFRKRIQTFITIGVIIFALYNFFILTNEQSIHENVIGKNTASNVENRWGRITDVYAAIQEHPFGNADPGEELETTNAGLFGFILLDGGFIYLFFWVFFLIYFYRKLYGFAKKSKYLLIYSGMFAFSFPMIWDCNYSETHLSFLFAFMIAFSKYDFLGMNPIGSRKRINKL